MGLRRRSAFSFSIFAVFCRLHEAAVGDAPFFVDMVPAAASASACSVRGLVADEHRAVNEPIEFTIHAADAFGNARPSAADKLEEGAIVSGLEGSVASRLESLRGIRAPSHVAVQPFGASQLS